jgi:hypothetical protein
MRTLLKALVALSFIAATAIGATSAVQAQGVYFDVPGAWALAIDTTIGVITITIIVAVAHITAADRVGLFRAETAHPIEDPVVRVGGTVECAGTVKHRGRLRAAFSFGLRAGRMGLPISTGQFLCPIVMR